LGDENSLNLKVVEKFLPSFKNTKNNADEGKEKIIKKIKENLEKQGIKYTDKSLIEILIIDGKNNFLI
jgi:NADPH-dependent 7-cyano-7-deazaguanine reductase QueF